jgi:hypothetical protein
MFYIFMIILEYKLLKKKKKKIKEIKIYEFEK